MNGAAEPLRLKVHGLDCTEEVAALRREVGPIVRGEAHLSFDIMAGTMAVDSPTPTRRIIAAVARTGMRAEVIQESQPTSGLQIHDDRRERNAY